jgi:tyrosine-protein phosphatase SIW14
MAFLSFIAKRILLCALALPAFGNSTVQGIENFYQVDQNVYRGAQPTEDGVSYLAKLGVKTVLDLRETDRRSKAEEAMVTAAGMKYVNVPMTGLKPPTEAEISRVLGILEGNSGSVFVHCKRGADRTGVVIASYRIDQNKWSNKQALDEAKARGMSFLQLPRMNYILAFRPHILQAKTVPTTAAVGPDAASSVIAPPAPLR